MVGSADTRLDAENTLKTIKSYESIAKKVSAPVVMVYVQNSSTTSRSDADIIMFNTILSLSVLFSQQNLELDSKDISNWLRYDRVTSYKPQIATLSLIEAGDVIKDIGNVISVATLAKEGASTTLIEMPEYQCVGFLPSGTDEPILSKTPLHFVISDGIISEVSKHLQKILSDVESAQQARIRKIDIVSDKDTIHESGLVM